MSESAVRAKRSWGLVWRGTGAGARCPSEPRPSGVHPEAGAVRSEKLREHTGSLGYPDVEEPDSRIYRRWANVTLVPLWNYIDSS